jgi:hypothetical protein
MYFQKFTNFIYDYELKPNERTAFIVTDITRNVRFRRDVLSNITVYDTYDIIDGETPSIIAEKFYGDPGLHWVVMLANDRYDYLKDFPLPYDTLNQFIKDKYGDNVYGVHHYEDENGNWVMPDFDGALQVTNFDYEQKINESKRTIKIITADVLAVVLKNFNDLI